jgi:hypothetical protein
LHPYIACMIKHISGWRSGKTLNSCSESILFESRPCHQVFRLRFSKVSVRNLGLNSNTESRKNHWLFLRWEQEVCLIWDKSQAIVVIHFGQKYSVTKLNIINILWHVGPLLGNDRETNNYIKAITWQRPVKRNRRMVFSVRFESWYYKQDTLLVGFSYVEMGQWSGVTEVKNRLVSAFRKELIILESKSPINCHWIWKVLWSRKHGLK